MKIGILTYHRAENYGALLQAYALLTYLRSLGHDVSFVDYWPKYHSDYFKLFSWNKFSKKGLKGKVLMLINLLMPSKYLRKYRLKQFMQEKLGIGKKAIYSDTDTFTEHYDVVFYGSDQIWRKQCLGGVGFDDWYFGANNVSADKKITYAASMGTIDVNPEDDEYVKGMMKNFDRISVREHDLLTYLHGLDVEGMQVIDPVFLLNKEQWRKIKKPSSGKGHFILFYNLLGSTESKRFATTLAEKTNLPIIEINKKTFPGSGYERSASVERFLQLVDDADFVVSNSFHGVALSIIFEKQFFAVGMGKKANRVVSLLETIGTPDRYISSANEVAFERIDYSFVNRSLSRTIASAEKFITESLS